MQTVQCRLLHLFIPASDFRINGAPFIGTTKLRKLAVQESTNQGPLYAQAYGKEDILFRSPVVEPTNFGAATAICRHHASCERDEADTVPFGQG